MKDPIHKEIHIDQIDLNDRSYIFTFEPPMSEMIASIQQIGMQNPPILEQVGQSTYRIVSGLRRIIALKHLGMKEFSAKIYSSENEEPNVHLFLLNLYENAAVRKFNIVEKALILERLVRLFHFSENEIIEKFFPLLELGSNKLVLLRYLNLVASEDYLKLALFADEISMDTVLTLLEMSPDERKFIFHFCQRLKLGKNNQKKFFRLLHDIARINETSFTQILKQPAIEKIMADEQLTLPVKGSRIKEILKKMRYPKLSEVEARFNNLKNELKLPPTINLKPSPFFEGDKYYVEFSFRNKDEFNRALTILNEIANKIDKLNRLV